MTRGAVATLMMAASFLVVSPADVAGAQENPYERGPDPTQQSVEAPTGPYDTDTATVPAGNGFGGGTVYYPTTTADGTFGAVAIAPGWTENQDHMSWLGPRLASQGFVIFTIDVNNTFLDFPDARGDQLLAALDFLVSSSSPVDDRIDPDRLGVMGHSMGGGGSLSAADSDPDLQAAIPLSGWHLTTDWSGVQTPTLVIGAENDLVAGVDGHSIPFYESLPSGLDKGYLELAGANHFTVLSDNDLVASQSISWLKRFIDNDTRYEQFLCPAPSGLDISDYRDTCPLDGGQTDPPDDPPDDECEWWDPSCWLN